MGMLEWNGEPTRSAFQFFRANKEMECCEGKLKADLLFLFIAGKQTSSELWLKWPLQLLLAAENSNAFLALCFVFIFLFLNLLLGGFHATCAGSWFWFRSCYGGPDNFWIIALGRSKGGYLQGLQPSVFTRLISLAAVTLFCMDVGMEGEWRWHLSFASQGCVCDDILTHITINSRIS